MAGMPYGLQSMLKEGHKHFSGIDEAVLKNIEAVKDLSKITRTSLGPNGMNKMVINHLDKLFVTSDAATIVKELEVMHPAANLIIMAAKAQEAELGDGTNLVLSLSGELLKEAEELIRDGLLTSEIADGYGNALVKILEILETLVIEGTDVCEMKDAEKVALRLKGPIASKQYGYEDFLGPLIAKACIDVCPDNTNNFNVDNVRVCKVAGGSILDSTVLKGLIFKRPTEGTIKKVNDAKVAVFAQGIDSSSTETKGTVLISTGEELENYSKTEEDKMEEYIKDIADTGVKFVVSGSAIGEMAMHFLERYGIMALRLNSKFELRRLCRATGATALVKMQKPTPDEIGFVREVRVMEVGDTIVTVLDQDATMGSVATILLRASTENVLDDMERAIDDGVNSYKALCRDPRMVPAGGAAEIEIAQQLAAEGRKIVGLEQYAFQAFGRALEVIPRTLAENAGQDATEMVSTLYAAHSTGKSTAGVNIEEGGIKDLAEDGIMDLHSTKYWALKLSVNAVMTVLRVDQIIMSKQAGGPKPKGPGMDED